MANRIKVGLIFGGCSAEHEVSLISARNIFAALDQKKYEVMLLGIGKDGVWHLCTPEMLQFASSNPKMVKLDTSGPEVTAVARGGKNEIRELATGKLLGSLDVVFPVLHGTNGEDGTMQGLLKLVGLPFVGPSVLGSAVGMDKDVAKRLLRDAGIPVARWLLLHDFDRDSITYESAKAKLGSPMFVKPANAGSSVGVSKVSDAASFAQAIDTAFKFDRKLLIEEGIVGKEVELSVLGNDAPQASLPGVVTADARHEFYSYDAKYVDEKGAALEIPAKLPADQIARLQELAVKTFRVLCLEGMSRVDFFLTADGNAYVNEVNTIPGFTNISMYPKLWEATGLGYQELIEKLITLAIERSEKEKRLQIISRPD